MKEEELKVMVEADIERFAEAWKKLAEMDENMLVPNSGSQNAINAGCTCPILDNENGLGYCFQKDVFVYSADCPLHKEALQRAVENSKKE